MIFLFQLIVLLFSVVIHEVSHGYWAYKLGDDTAYLMGRLTLNPLAHLDPFGSIILPLCLYFLTGGSLVFGWAKPVSFNPLKLKNPRRDSALLAFGGPLANLSVALIFGLIIRLFVVLGYPAIIPFFSLIVEINLVLAIFNLIPIPPLDGSKILFYFFPSIELESFLHRYGFLFIFLVLMFGWSLIFPAVSFLYHLFTGFYF
jgi:Zn-dependent protease